MLRHGCSSKNFFCPQKGWLLDLEQAAKMASQAKPSLEKSLACFASQAVLSAKSQIGNLKPSQAFKKACLIKMASSSHKISKPSQAASFFSFKNKANLKHFRALLESYNYVGSSQCFINTIFSISLINATLWVKIFVVLTNFASQFHVKSSYTFTQNAKISVSH